MKKNATNIILVIIFLIGLSVLLYPSLSDYWNSKTQSKALSNYEELLEELAPEDFSELFRQAELYNQRLLNTPYPLANFAQVGDYAGLLNVANNGMMGYISIDKIKVELPVYHGVSDGVLNVAVGHLEGSSLPIGGTGTHSVLSAHRGLPSARLFTDLDQLIPGDQFTLVVLGRVLTYEVDLIQIIEPSKVSALAIEEGKDYCTLFTCTPYTINTHRLLVRGHRIETEAVQPIRYVPPDAYLVDPLLVAPLVAFPMLLVLLVVLLVKYRKKKD